MCEYSFSSRDHLHSTGNLQKISLQNWLFFPFAKFNPLKKYGLCGILCDRAGCEIRLMSYGTKHSLQFLFENPFVHSYTLNFKITGCIWMFCTSNDCSSIRDIPRVQCSLELHEKSKWKATASDTD